LPELRRLPGDEPPPLTPANLADALSILTASFTLSAADGYTLAKAALEPLIVCPCPIDLVFQGHGARMYLFSESRLWLHFLREGERTTVLAQPEQYSWLLWFRSAPTVLARAAPRARSAWRPCSDDFVEKELRAHAPEGTTVRVVVENASFDSGMEWQYTHAFYRPGSPGFRDAQTHFISLAGIDSSESSGEAATASPESASWQNLSISSCAGCAKRRRVTPTASESPSGAGSG
jgi:hypothetical protein